MVVIEANVVQRTLRYFLGTSLNGDIIEALLV
jgi:hypothetical protein